MELEKNSNFIFKNAVYHFSTNYKELSDQISNSDEDLESSEPKMQIL